MLIIVFSHTRNMKLINLIICFFPSIIEPSGVFIKSLNISCHPEYFEKFIFSITTNPKDDLDYVVSARGIMKKQIPWIQGRSQIYSRQGRIFDYKLDLCHLFSKKNSGDIFYGYLKKMLKIIKNIKLECPMEPVSPLFQTKNQG